jgi:small-conductance mechanosensitive channel
MTFNLPAVEDVWRALKARSFLGVAIDRWAVFLAGTALVFLVLYLARGLARKRLAARAARTGYLADLWLARLFEQTWTSALVAVAALAALNLGGLKPVAAGARLDPEHYVRGLALLVVFLQLGRWGAGFIDTALERGFRLAKLSDTAAQSAIGVVRFFALAALWTCVAILALDTLGIQVSPLLAGLGIGGIAAGFALQRILGDIFCSVAILLDRPFEVGDFIEAGSAMGTVERIGVRTTRVRSLGGEQIIFPNADLIQSRIRNFKRMTERRISFRFGVAYGTPATTVERIPGLVRDIIEGLDTTRLDRVHFAAFGDTGMNFEAVYFVLDPDMNRAMDLQQKINLELLTAFERLGIRFAQPRAQRDVAETEKKD